MHVLPSGFQKIRYYGFLNNSTRKKNLESIFSQQGGRKYTPKFDRTSPLDVIAPAAWNINPKKCPCCGKDALEYITSSMELGKIEASFVKGEKKFARRSPRARPA